MELQRVKEFMEQQLSDWSEMKYEVFYEDESNKDYVNVEIELLFGKEVDIELSFTLFNNELNMSYCEGWQDVDNPLNHKMFWIEILGNQGRFDT